MQLVGDDRAYSSAESTSRETVFGRRMGGSTSLPKVHQRYLQRNATNDQQLSGGVYVPGLHSGIDHSISYIDICMAKGTMLESEISSSWRQLRKLLACWVRP